MSDRPRLEVYSFKEGLLSAVAHDLKLTVRDFEPVVRLDPPAVSVSLRASSLEVVSAMKDGREDPCLSAADLGEIQRNLVTKVLAVERFPTIEFVSDRIEGGFVSGRLTLCGVTRPLRFPWKEEGGRRVAEVELDQRDFGIKPFSAMMGTLKVKPTVRVRVSLPA